MRDRQGRIDKVAEMVAEELEQSDEPGENVTATVSLVREEGVRIDPFLETQVTSRVADFPSVEEYQSLIPDRRRDISDAPAELLTDTATLADDADDEDITLPFTAAQPEAAPPAARITLPPPDDWDPSRLDEAPEK